MKMEVALIANNIMNICLYAKLFFWNFEKEIQYDFNTKRRNQESYMQTHTHIKISLKLCSSAIDWEQQNSRT